MMRPSDRATIYVDSSTTALRQLFRHLSATDLYGTWSRPSSGKDGTQRRWQLKLRKVFTAAICRASGLDFRRCRSPGSPGAQIAPAALPESWRATSDPAKAGDNVVEMRAAL
jgi:hypothetical protein